MGVDFEADDELLGRNEDPRAAEDDEDEADDMD
jgi:hypothetical protein